MEHLDDQAYSQAEGLVNSLNNLRFISLTFTIAKFFEQMVTVWLRWFLKRNQKLVNRKTDFI